MSTQRNIKPRLSNTAVLRILGLLLITSGCTPSYTDPPGVIATDVPELARSMPSVADKFNGTLGALGSGDFVNVPDFSIGPQDLLEVNLFNIDAADGIPNKVQVRVSNNGQVTLPLIGQVSLQGLTRAQAEHVLKQRYNEFMHNAEIGVTLVENRSNSVYVLGAIKTPGVIPITGQETLRRVIAMAGGLLPEAGMYAHVSRNNFEHEQVYVINLAELTKDPRGKLNLGVLPGDFINVPRAGSFFVDGQVERPNAYQLVRPYNLSQALAIAGGLSEFASREITIIRRNPNGEVRKILRDLDKIHSGDQEDPKITENDLIVVPPNRAKIILQALLGAVGYTSRGAGYSFGIGRTGLVGRAVLP